MLGKLSVEIEDPVQTGAAFVATNNGVQYSVSPAALIITRGSTVMSNEPMLECWSANRRGQREGGAETLLSLNRSAGQGRWFVHVHV